MPAPISDAAPTRPGGWSRRPPLEVPAARPPLASTQTAPIVAQSRSPTPAASLAIWRSLMKYSLSVRSTPRSAAWRSAASGVSLIHRTLRTTATRVVAGFEQQLAVAECVLEHRSVVLPDSGLLDLRERAHVDRDHGPRARDGQASLKS